MITQNQWSYLKHWIWVVLIVEAAMFVLNRYLTIAYLIIALLFLIALILRIFKLYPGKTEPLLLDASGLLIATIFAAIADAVQDSNFRFALILISSIIILSHIVYILSKKDI